MKENVFFVSGIDTNVGKSYATGHIARMWMDEGRTVITQKLVQTGNHGMSEDIELHRKIMDIGLTADDVSKTTMPEIFSYPCSPHLAAKIDGRDIDFAHIERCTRLLSDKYDRVLLEGAGGLMVPLTEDLFTYYNPALHKWTVEEGTYRIHVGNSSRNLPLCVEKTMKQNEYLTNIQVMK